MLADWIDVGILQAQLHFPTLKCKIDPIDTIDMAA